MSTPAVFFDRDGTLMVEVHYCSDPAKVAVYPGVSEGLKRLKQAGFKIIIITNQSGIGRGYFTDEQYQLVHQELLRQIGPGLVDATYYCPAGPDENCSRRKPEPGMVLEAQKEHQVDLSRSYFVGDKPADVQCGQNSGVRATVLVQTGYGAGSSKCNPDYVAKDVLEAIEYILSTHSA